MNAWIARDIRRTLPPYVEREGDVVYNAPYRATCADLDIVVLSASPSKLQGLIDEQLKDCVGGKESLVGSQVGLEFFSREPWVLFIYAGLQSLSSADQLDEAKGNLGAFELSVWVPIIKRQSVANSVLEEPVWYLPLVYTAPTASAVTGREVYGYPKVPAYLEVEDGVPIYVNVQNGIPGGKAPDGTSSPTRRHRSSHVFSIEDESARFLPVPLDRNDHPLLGAVLERCLANLPAVFRKQIGWTSKARGSEEVNAHYTALIESRVPLVWLQSLDALEMSPTVHVAKGHAAATRVADALGLDTGKPEFRIAARGCTLDIQGGREIWVASGPAPRIEPLDAPGNALLRAGGDGIESLDRFQATAEVYVVSARPRAVAALLSRHFPPSVGEERPQAFMDPGATILLTFLRSQQADSVKLYEFSVWVPVVYKGEPAWYIPYMFRSPGAAVVHAREWNGHPCQEAFITFDDRSPSRGVALSGPTFTGRGAPRWSRSSRLNVDPFDPETAPTKDEIDVARSLAKLVVEEKQRIVSLLQVRHVADTQRACVQRVAAFERTTENAGPASAPKTATLVIPPHLKLAQLFDLDGPKQSVLGFEFKHVEISTHVPSEE
jgi:hypothetical protein